MKKIVCFLFIINSLNTFSQILSPSGNNIFYYNGAADVIFKYPERGSGGRAFVHAPNNVLALNYAEDFNGGTLIGNNVYFKDGGNSFIYSGNFGIGTSTPSGTLHLQKLNSSLVFDLNTSGICKIISKGWNANIDVHTFKIDGTENFNQLNLNSNGNVGIGNSSPDAPLTVYGISNFYPIRIGSGDARQFSIRHSFINPDFINNLYPVILGTGGGDQPLILDVARVGIGISNPSNKLDVNGTIHSKEVKVDMQGWSDFVFKKEYNLPTLEEVEKHINKKGHLENIPNEDEVLKNGINLGEMNSKLLQKIEELTLYAIQQNKKIEEQSREIETLKALAFRVAKIEKELNQK
ncbi:hypothetical protein [Flavobacterium sp. 22076]|uniref:hypothetical protein n=1 Tax=unclassified Flavobacterium TaxID=196869 RepID=UPI003F8349F7